jgi:hypothetical protein
MKKLPWVSISIVAFIAFFVGLFIIGFFDLVNKSEVQIVETAQLPIGRYTVAGATVADRYNTSFLILDTATGEYQVIIVARVSGDVKIMGMLYGRVE